MLDLRVGKRCFVNEREQIHDIDEMGLECQMCMLRKQHIRLFFHPTISQHHVWSAVFHNSYSPKTFLFGYKSLQISAFVQRMLCN